MIAQSKIKEKVEAVVNQFNSSINGDISYSQLLQMYTLAVSDTLCFYIDGDMQMHVLHAQIDDDEYTCEPSIEHKSITDYDCITQIKHIYVNKLDNDKHQYFIVDNSLLKNEDGEVDLVVYRSSDPQSFFYANDNISRIESNAFIWMDNEQTFIDLSRLNRLTCIPDHCWNNDCQLYSINHVILPGSIKYIGESAFEKCTQLSSIESVNDFLSLDYISYNAFFGCTALTGINISNSSLSTIQTGAFSGCTSIKSIVLPNTLSTLNSLFASDEFYMNASLSSIDISNTSIEKIDGYQFSNCMALHQLLMPHTIRIFNDSAIVSCDSLSMISFEDTDGVVSIDIDYNVGKVIDGDLSIIVRKNMFKLSTQCPYIDELYDNLIIRD